MWLSLALCCFLWLSLSLALSQSERARENLCGSLWLSVVLSLWLTLALSLALWLVLSLSDSLALSGSLFWLSVKHVFLFNVEFLLQLCKTTPIVAKR